MRFSEPSLGAACLTVLIGIGVGIYFSCKHRKESSVVAAENETTLVAVIVDGQSQVESQPVAIVSIDNQDTSQHRNENLEIDDLPTFDEALKMEVVNVQNSQCKLKKQDFCDISKKDDELPGYETATNKNI